MQVDFNIVLRDGRKMLVYGEHVDIEDPGVTVNALDYSPFHNALA